MSSETPSVIHLPVRAGLQRVIQMCIEHGDDPAFVDEIMSTGGFEMFSRSPLWRTMELLARDGANRVLFPDGSVDETVFFDTLERNGFTESRKWLMRRLIRTTPVPVTGRKRDGVTQRVFYIPVGSLLETARRQPARAVKRTHEHLTEEL